MRALKAVGNVVLWLLAAVGILSAVLWGATRLGYVQPLVVISGSMEPGIMTGDLLIDVRTPTQDVHVGEVAAIYNPVTRNLVSHRVISIEQTGDASWDVQMKGDANSSADGGVYEVGPYVWQPVLQVPGAGRMIAAVARPSVAIPLGVTILALIGLSTIARPEDRAHKDADVPAPEDAVAR
jgi:signal peptidase